VDETQLNFPCKIKYCRSENGLRFQKIDLHPTDGRWTDALEAWNAMEKKGKVLADPEEFTTTCDLFLLV
jgi:hypothetical protein